MSCARQLVIAARLRACCQDFLISKRPKAVLLAKTRGFCGFWRAWRHRSSEMTGSHRAMLRGRPFLLSLMQATLFSKSICFHSRLRISPWRAPVVREILTGLDLTLYFLSPIFCLPLPFKMVADGRVAFNSDNCTPDSRAVVVFTFKNRCHNSNLWLKILGWMALLVKIVLHCTVSNNFNLLLDIGSSSVCSKCYGLCWL